MQQNTPNSLITNNSYLTNPTNISGAAVKQYSYRIIRRLPHDEQAFTQGLVLQGSVIYESTGLLGQSEIRKFDLNSGELKQTKKLEPYYFGEGISIVDNQIVQLTWGTEHVFVYDVKHLEQLNDYKHSGEGWGITAIDKQLLVSDGSATLKWLNNKNGELNNIHVTENGEAVQGLNELEYANGFIYANIWPGDCIARIDPESGNIDAWINLDGLYDEELRPHWSAVLNGIAYRKETKTFFVTGKYWPFIYELEFIRGNEKEG